METLPFKKRYIKDETFLYPSITGDSEIAKQRISPSGVNRIVDMQCLSRGFKYKVFWNDSSTSWKSTQELKSCREEISRYYTNVAIAGRDNYMFYLEVYMNNEKRLKECISRNHDYVIK